MFAESVTHKDTERSVFCNLRTTLLTFTFFRRSPKNFQLAVIKPPYQ